MYIIENIIVIISYKKIHQVKKKYFKNKPFKCKVEQHSFNTPAVYNSVENNLYYSKRNCSHLDHTEVDNLQAAEGVYIHMTSHNIILDVLFLAQK